jgi:hypothetical protein
MTRRYAPVIEPEESESFDEGDDCPSCLTLDTALDVLIAARREGGDMAAAQRLVQEAARECDRVHGLDRSVEVAGQPVTPRDWVGGGSAT